MFLLKTEIFFDVFCEIIQKLWFLANKKGVIYINHNFFIVLCYNSNPQSIPFSVAGTPFFIQEGAGAPFRK